MEQIKCEGCGQETPGYDIVHLGSMEDGYKQLCTRCYNAEVAALMALDGSKDVRFEPVMLADAAGIAHTFHFRTRLFGTGMSLQAFELRDGAPGGYQFEVHGDPQGEPIVLLGRLFEKMRRDLSVKHLEEGDLGLHIAEDKDIVRGRITSDEGHDGRMPLLIIDGREVTWEAFGHMLMTFEGWQFKMEIRDRSEEI